MTPPPSPDTPDESSTSGKGPTTPPSGGPASPAPVEAATRSPGEQATPPPGSDAGADELAADIERTRQQLGDTVDSLSAKFDAKSQAQQAMQETKQRAAAQLDAGKARGDQALARAKEATTDEQGALTPAAQQGIGVVVALLGLVVAWRWRRR